MSLKNFIGSFPQTRLRRLRHSSWCRNLHQETHLSVKDLVWPIFIRDPQTEREISAMPGVPRHTVEEAAKAAQEAYALGIEAIALFPYTDPSLKTPDGEEALNPDNLVCQATRAIKAACPQIGVIVDVALDPYTSHGHDGLLVEDEIVNDPTLTVLQEQALTLARAGVDAVSPSDMMDGRVRAIRTALDAEGFQNTLIISYSAKYASAIYGPFRQAAGSLGNLGKGSKATYQMNPANTQEALREVAQDIEEGADVVMVKPGTFYLDILQRVTDTFSLPVHVYHISGEYSMLKAASQMGYIDYDKALLENLLAFKRAGAKAIWTYAACHVAKLLG